MTVSRSYTRHSVTVEISAPVRPVPYAKSKRYRPEVVVISYVLDHGSWRVREVTMHGPSVRSDGSFGTGRGTEAFYTTDAWPDYLADIVDAYRPTITELYA